MRGSMPHRDCRSCIISCQGSKLEGVVLFAAGVAAVLDEDHLGFVHAL